MTQLLGTTGSGRATAPLPPAELAGLARDGLVVPVGPAWASPAEIDDRALRLRALATLLPRDVVASGTTAAWAWHVTGAWTRPAQACVDVRGRHGIRVPGVRVSEVVLAEEDVDRTGAVPVTTRLRTALDLLRATGWTPWHRALVVRLLDDDATVGPGLQDRLAGHRRLPHARRARGRLEGLGPAPGGSRASDDGRRRPSRPEGRVSPR